MFRRPALLPRRIRRALVAAWACAFLAETGGSVAGTLEDSFEKGRPRFRLGSSDCRPRVVGHALAGDAAHRGLAGERVVLEAAAGTTLRLEFPLGAMGVIDEFQATVWVRSNRPAVRLAVKVSLPDYQARTTGRPVELFVAGEASRHADRWERLEIGGIAAAIERQLPAVRAQHGPDGSTAGAAITHLVLDLASAPGRHDVCIDDLRVEGTVPLTAALAAAGKSHPSDVSRTLPGRGRGPSEEFLTEATGVVTPAAYAEPAPAVGAAAETAALTRGVLEVGGLPFFPRSLDHNGEPLAVISSLGFNCVRLSAPATAEVLEEARQAGVWLISPPPELPDVDVRNAESIPAFSPRWDRVVFWDMGGGLSEPDAAALAERVRRVRTCDARGGRPVIAGADSGLRSISRHVDMLVARRTVLGTSLELLDYLAWLRERPRLARPGTPILAALSTEIDPRTARQAAALSGIGGKGLAVDPESLCLASLAVVSAGARGILFASGRRIDGDDRESRARAAASLAMNLQLKLLEPWGAAGRFTAAAQASDPEVQAVVLEASRARMVAVWRCAQGSQIVARQYHGDIPRDAQPLTLLVPGVPEAHQAWEVAPGGLRPLRHKRVTGGISLTLESFRSHGLVLLSGDPAVTAHVQERVRELAPLDLASARASAAVALEEGAALAGRLPPAALGNLPVAAMLAEAERSARQAESAGDVTAVIEQLRRSASIAAQVERLAWERGVLATGSMVASPLSTSDATLAEHWRFIEALAATAPAAELVPGGGMEQIEEVAAAGWRHFALEQEGLRTAVEIDRGQPAVGRGSLLLRAEPTSPEQAPVVVETPPVWVTTPPVRVPPGKLVEIGARVWVPRPIKGSVDGLLVFDSFGGPALAERVGITPAWRRLVLYRIAPADVAEAPLTVTFALTGMGEARLDEVSIRVLERTAGGVPATVVSAGPPAVPSFPQPGDLLAGPGVGPLPAASSPAAEAEATGRTQESPATTSPSAGLPWPGMMIDWPKLLPFGQSSNALPPGPGGGTVDPFQRARDAQP